MGVELFNNNWEAIHQRFLPAKTPHQISIRYKNCVSGRQPFNPIKAVRERKLSPLTVQEKLSINEALKVQRMDWNQVWQCCVPYRDPAQLPRLWRAACGLPLQSRTAANAQKHRLAKRRRAAQQLELSKLLGLGGEKTTSSFQNGMGVAIVESSEERTESDDDTDDDTNSFENEFIREAFLLKDASQPKNPLLQNVAASSEVSSHPSGTATKPRHENAQKSLAEQTSPAVLQEDVGTCTLAGRHATSVSSSSGVQAVASVLMQDINAVQGESVGTHISRINECQQFTENVPPRSAHQGGSGWKRRTRTSKVAVRNLPPIVLPNGKIICLGNQGTSSTMPQGAAITLKGQAPCNQVSRSRHDIVAGVTSGSMEGVRNGPRKNSRELDRSQRPRRGENGRYNNNASQRNAVETMGSGILAGTPNRAMQQTAVVSAGYVRNGGPAQHEINAEREADRLTSHAHIETVVEGGSVVEGRGRLSGAELEGMASDHPHPLLFGGEKRASRKKKNAVQARHQDAEKITVHSDIERNVVGNSEFGNIASGSILQERRGATSRLIAISEATALDSWLPNKSRGTNRAENDNNRRVFDFDLNEVDQGTRSIRAFDFDLNEGPGTEVGDGRLRTSQNLSVTMAGILQQNKKRRSGQQHSYPGGGFYAVGREIGAKTLPQGEPLVTSDKATMSPARVLEEAPHSGGGTGTDKDGTHCTDCHMIEFEREEMSDSETEQEQGR